MKKSVIFAGICIMLLLVGSAFAQGTPSAKFAATWSKVPGLESVAVIEYTDTDEVVMVGPNEGYTLARIKVPQDKELMVGVSAEIGIVTDTSVKGKLGGTAKAIADGEAYVNVYAVPVDGGNSIPAEPGQIMLSKRVQALSATLGGVIDSCTVPCSLVDGVLQCEDIIIGEDCIVYDEEIGLLLDTTAAHHFNFVLPNMPQGVYDIKAVFTTGARAEVDICDFGEDCYDEASMEYAEVFARSYAKAIINKTMVTVQQVRAAADGLQEVTITE